MNSTNLGSSDSTVVISNYDIIVAANRKGGIGKTLLIIFLMACALMHRAMICAFEIDRQNRLKDMYPKLVRQIDLPDSDKLIVDDLAESRALAPVFNALRSAPDTGLIFVDIGANYDERFAKSVSRARLNDQIVQAGRRVCILVPIDAAADTIIAAASAAQQFSIALPAADIVFVQREAKLVIDTGRQSRLSEEAKQAYREVIAPLLTPETTITTGQMRKGVHKAFVAMAKNPFEFMSTPPELLGAAAAGAAGNPLEDEFAGEEIRAHFEDFVGQINEEAQRVLGFRSGPAATKKDRAPRA